jgi:hypothetical protein
VVDTSLDRGTATRIGRWLGRAVRVAFALLLLGGVLASALTAARREPLTALGDDLSAGRVSEVSFDDGGPPHLQWGRDDPGARVRWKVVGSGWRVASLSGASAGALGPAGGFVTSSGTIGPDGVVVDDVGADPDGQAVRRRVEAAGIPIATTAPQVPQLLGGLSALAGVLLILVMIGAPQPRRATKWAWFWLLLVPGGLTQLAWLAVEAPWSERANRQPEPLPHKVQPADGRLTGGRAFLVSVLLSVLIGWFGWQLAGWLAG